MARAKEITPDGVEEQMPKVPSLIYASGRGNSGKTTGIRLIIERAMFKSAPILIADCDRTNQTLSAFLPEGVDRPDHPDDDSVINRMNEIINTMVERRESAVFDMGAGDLVFPRYAASMKLVEMLDEAEIRPVALHFIGPALDDLSVLHEIESAGSFCPSSTALILNAGLIRDTRSPDVAFAATRVHPIYRAAIDRGAKEILMPKLGCMPKLDAHRMFFHAAAAGRTDAGQPPLGFTERHMVKIWLRQMEAALEPIGEWLP